MEIVYEYRLLLETDDGSILLSTSVGDSVSIPPGCDKDGLDPYLGDAQESAIAKAKEALHALHPDDGAVSVEEANLSTLSADRLSFSCWVSSPTPLHRSFSSYYRIFLKPFIP